MKINLNSLIFIALSIALFIGASYSQSGWQYLFLSLLLGCIIVGIIMPFWNLRNIEVNKRVPSKMQVGKYSIVRVEIENESQKAKRFINIVDYPLEPPKGSIDVFTLEKIFKKKLTKKSLPKDFDFMYLLKMLPAKDKKVLKYSFLPPGRGYIKSGPVKISNSSPFRIVTRTKVFNTAKNILVYPKVINIRGGWANRIAQKPVFTEMSRSFAPTSFAATTRSLREYFPGDSPKYIHWPTSAKQNKLMVREFEVESKGYIVIVFNSLCNYMNKDYYELAVVTAASLLNICHKDNLTTRLITQESAYSGFDDFKDDDWESQLELLARVKPVSDDDIYSRIDSELSKHSNFEPLFILISPFFNADKPLKTTNIINISVSPGTDSLADYTISSEDNLRYI